jgi:hypothetical protein
MATHGAIGQPSNQPGEGPRNRSGAAYCRALGWLRIGARKHPVAPLLGLKYLATLLACIAGLIAILELRLGTLAAEWRVVSDEWQVENEDINRMNLAKVKSKMGDPLWRSDGMPWPERKPDLRRILVVGDSFVWGDGNLNANDIWWRQLERELRGRGYGLVEVVAIGYPGASTQDQVRWLRDMRLLETVNPDMVVLGYVTNDPEVRDDAGRPLVRQIGRDIPMPTWSALDTTLGLVAPRLTYQLKQLLTRKWETRVSDAYRYNEWELRILEGANFDAYRKVVRELGDAARVAGVPVLVVTLPNEPDLSRFELRYGPVRALFESAGMRFHDLLPAFVKEYSPPTGAALRWGVNPANGHPGPVATRFFARQVSDLLERDHPEALGPRRPGRSQQARINDWMPPSANVRQIAPGEWALVYPAAAEPAPKLPIEKPHVVLAFSEPAAVKSVWVSGAGLRAAELYLTSVDPRTGVERNGQAFAGARSGDALNWALDNVPGAGEVNTLKLAATVETTAGETSPRDLRLRIEFDSRMPKP